MYNKVYSALFTPNLLKKKTGNISVSCMGGTDFLHLSGIRESNPPPRLGKPMHYRCANSAYLIPAAKIVTKMRLSKIERNFFLFLYEYMVNAISNSFHYQHFCGGGGDAETFVAAKAYDPGDIVANAKHHLILALSTTKAGVGKKVTDKFRSSTHAEGTETVSFMPAA